MENLEMFKNQAIACVENHGILEKFKSTAVNHSHNTWKVSAPQTPLILDFELNLILLCHCSSKSNKTT